MSGLGNLLGGIAAVLWVLLALVIFVFLWPVLKKRIPSLTKLGVSPAGINMEFAGEQLDKAVASTTGAKTGQAPLGQAARQGILHRLDRNVDLLGRARVLWVDDHPENNVYITKMLESFGTRN